MGRRNDINAELKSLVACASANSGAPSVITAAGTGDATKVTGQTIDALGYGSASLCVAGLCSMGNTETLTIAAELQESADGSTWDTAEALYAATTVATSDTSADKIHFEKQTAINMEGRKRYIRFNITPNLSASSTDTAEFVAVAVLGGARLIPAS
jgi:hypothetical protein